MVSNASGFYLRAIASPINSAQFRTIPRNSKTVACNSAQLRAIPRNGIPIGNPKSEFSHEVVDSGSSRSIFEE